MPLLMCVYICIYIFDILFEINYVYFIIYNGIVRCSFTGNIFIVNSAIRSH